MRRDFKPLEAKVNAKINIGLQIVRKRPDGYHDLQTVFYPTDFFSDILTISPSEQELVFRMDSQEDLGNNDNNLCVKAFRILQRDYGISGVEIYLKKGIPSGAGLGGGSADAAFTLKMLKEIFQLSVSEEKMVQYALQLGSDVPFFLYNTPMYATGRGEVMSPIDLDLSGYQLKIVKPDIHISTKEAYAGVTPHESDIYLPEVLKTEPSKWKNLIVNDFEESLFVKIPALQEVKERLYHEGALYASMSGSGSSFFGIFPKNS